MLREDVTFYSKRCALVLVTVLFGLTLFSALPNSALAQQCTSATGSGLCPGNPPPRIDLASMCFDTATQGSVSFSMTFVSSNPDGAACAFFDTDSDGNANFAACVRTDASDKVVYQCNDTSSHACPGFSAVSAPSFSCSVNAGLVACTINTSDIGSSNAILGNICSYTSNDGVDPNGICKDCVNQGAQIHIKKLATDKFNSPLPENSSPVFNFTVSSPSTLKAAAIAGSGSSQVAVPAGVYAVSENLPAGWELQGVTCSSGSGASIGSLAVNGMSDIALLPGEVAVCSFANKEINSRLHIKKSTTATSYNAIGQLIPYTFEVTNTGDVTVSNIAVFDTKICTTPAPCIPCTPNTLAPNEVVTCGPVNYAVTQLDINQGTLLNTAYATGVFSGVPVSSNQDQVTIKGSRICSLSVDKSGVFNDLNSDTYAQAGETVSYSVKVTNSGNTTVSLATVTDPLITTLSCTPSLTATLQPSEFATCTGDYTLVDGDITRGYVLNTATACGTFCKCSDPGNICETGDHRIDLPYSDALDIAKTGTYSDANNDKIVSVGDVIDYVITVKNTGSRTAPVVTVSDPMLSSLSCIPSNGSDLAVGQSMVCSGQLPLGQSEIDSCSITNVASASSAITQPVTVTSSITLPVTEQLSITKSGQLQDQNANGFADLGEEIGYSIEVKNIGSTTLANVVVSDSLLSGLLCTPNTNPLSLQPLSSVSCTGKKVLTAQDIELGTITNQAAAEASNRCSNSGPRVTASHTVSLKIAPTPTPTATATATATPTATGTASSTVVATSTPTPTSTPDSPVTATATATPVETSAPGSTVVPSPTPTTVVEATATNTPVPQVSPAPTSTPAVVATATPTLTPSANPEPVCSGRDIAEAQFRIDGAAREQKILIQRAANRLLRAANSPSNRRFVKQIILQADQVYGISWRNVWSIPSVVVTCESSSNCVTVSLTSEFDSVAANSELSLSLTSKVAARLRRIKSLLRYATLVDRQAKGLHTSNLKILADMPKSHTTCAVLSNT